MIRLFIPIRLTNIWCTYFLAVYDLVTSLIQDLIANFRFLATLFRPALVRWGPLPWVRYLSFVDPPPRVKINVWCSHILYPHIKLESWRWMVELHLVLDAHLILWHDGQLLLVHQWETNTCQWYQVLCRTMACFERDLHTLISGGDHRSTGTIFSCFNFYFSWI